MNELSPRHIENCSREISRWSKAVRLIHALERNLPPGILPEPDLIEPSRKPFDLRVVWEADNPGHGANLRKRIVAALKLDGLKQDGMWRHSLDVRGESSLRTRIRIGEKTTIYLQLVVADGGKGSRD